MAPLTSEPDAIRVALNLARRKVFYALIIEITAYMRSQLELPHSPDGSPSFPSSTRNPPPYSEAALSRSNTIPTATPSNRAPDSNTPAPTTPPGPQQQQQRTQASPALVRLRKAALLHFDSWRDETVGRIKDVVAKPDDQKVLDARRKRAEGLAARSREMPGAGEDLLSFRDDNRAGITDGAGAGDTPPLPPRGGRGMAGTGPTSLSAFQSLYHPIPTRLTSVSMEDRKEVLSATLICLLAIGNYSAYSRTLVCYLASALEVPPAFLDREEMEVATTMVEAARKAEREGQGQGEGGMSAEAEARKRREEGKVGRLWKVGLASVAGAAIIGVTGGLAAPAVAGVIGGLMGSVGLGGLASFLGIFWMNGALVGTLFGAFGAKMTGDMVDQYAKEVEDFKFLPLKEEWGRDWADRNGDGAKDRRLRVTIGINGWLTAEEDVTKPWRALGDETEVFALRYEMKSLMALGEKLRGLVASAAWSAVRAEILQRTVLATLSGALWPIFLLNSASNIDNPFSLAKNRSEKAGRILADALINRVQGERPVTLVGYSLGARVIYSCLRSLAERKAFGLIDTVVLIGAPVPSNNGYWEMMRTVVSGRLFNVYSENDYILGFLYRTTSLQLGIAGLQAITGDIEGVENLDLSNEVTGHMRYPELVPKILARCGFPDIRGGKGAIEKDDGKIEIELKDKDWAETGNLIDIEDKPEKNEKYDPIVKNVMELKSDVGVRNAKLDGLKDAKEREATQTTTRATSSLPNLGELPRASTTPSISTTTTLVEPPPSYPGTEHRVNYDDDSDFDHAYDSEEEGFGGIRMMDNDPDEGGLTFIEPLQINDD
ncbi:DUF726-domain-containing protein [Annulohypoxylon maeteangense]|uniref:DUF726-domain-containing protein n=1 Tax=Annulohypoxylon maeteangense TaxID=1927788 RepID=UPI002008EA59|nr:DUF726-domain-containing protein [Annulohypoxylon maeteangense]KAI0882254.1 DUF726-domain-containing protein [Annulohypoxylon maeteangense]